MKKIAENILALAGKDEKIIRQEALLVSGDVKVYGKSIHKLNDAVLFVARNDEERFFGIVSPGNMPEGFEGETFAVQGGSFLKCKLDTVNGAALRKYFPWTAPVSLRKERTTVGCGDRLGLATVGHLLAARKYKVSPVLAQQSLRELTMTKRTFQELVDCAGFMVFQMDYQDGYGADGDHLKKIPDMDVALEAGMPMITLDLSDVMNAAAGDWDCAAVEEAFSKLPCDTQKRIAELYADKTFAVPGSEVALDALTAKRCAVMYDAALDFAFEVYEHLKAKRGDEFDLEISIDETSSPTLPSHHLYIASELVRRGIQFSSLAPRFIGEFQKAIDYIGDLEEFDRQFKVHAAIAKAYGNYKVSVHSGSDKFAVYPTIGRETAGYLHLKTAGTSWLVAVEVIAKCDPALYRDMHKCARENYNDMLKLYHITADITKIPALESLTDAQLPSLMEMPEARQMLHITYGPILTSDLRTRFFKAMHKFEDEYSKALEKHFDKHLSLLGAPLK